MSKQTKNTENTMPDGPDHESLRSRAIEDIARQIAVLVVRQHRRCVLEEGKKSGKNAL